MRLVVADTTPLNYLILIEQIDLLATLFAKIFVPKLVMSELFHEDAPESVRRWVATIPPWIEVVAALHRRNDPTLAIVLTKASEPQLSLPLK